MNHRSFHPLPPPPGSASSEGDTVLDFGKIFQILRQGWWIIAGLGFTGALLAAVLVLQVEPTYSAKAQLLMGQNNRPGGTLGALMQDLNLDDDAITGEMAIINSGRVLSQVTRKLDLVSQPEFNAALRPPEPEPGLIARLSDQGVELLKSVIGVGPTAVDASGAEGDETGELTPDVIETTARVGKESLGDQADYVDQLKRGLRVRRVGNSNLVDVQFLSTNRLLSAAIPNAVVEVYLEDQLDRKFRALRRVTEGLETRLSAMRERLEASERAVIDYRNQNLSEGFGGQKQLDQQLADLSRRVGQADAEQAELASDLAGIDALIADRGAVQAAGLFQSDVIERLQSQVIELHQRRTLLMERFGEDNRQVQDVENEVARTEALIQAEVQRLRDNQANKVDLAAARVEALRQQLADLENRAIEQAERDVRLAQFERDYAAERAVYTTFLDKFTQTSEVASLQEGDAQIIAYADPPPSPVAPNKKLAVALGGIAGGFAGLGLVFLRVLADRAVRNTAQLAAITSGGVFTQYRTSGLPLRRPSPLTTVSRNPRSPMSESINALRSDLMLSMPKDRQGGKVISVVSTRANYGKTTTSILLARSLAQMGVPCVLVEADLRRASIAGQLDLSSQPDIISVLMGNASLDEALHTDPGSNARVLTAGSALVDPAGILLSDAMADLLVDLRSKFRFVIVDTAPMGLFPDATPIVRMSDNVVLMVRFGSPIQEAEAALYQLGKLGATRVSTVLSMARGKEQNSQDYYNNAETA